MGRRGRLLPRQLRAGGGEVGIDFGEERLEAGGEGLDVRLKGRLRVAERSERGLGEAAAAERALELNEALAEVDPVGLVGVVVADLRERLGEAAGEFEDAAPGLVQEAVGREARVFFEAEKREG